MKFDAEDRPRRTLYPLQLSAPDIEAWLLDRDPLAIGSFRQLGIEEYARAFTAAQTAGADVIDDIYFALVDVVSRGGAEVDFQSLVIPTLEAKGWLGGNRAQIATRVRLIYDTNLRLARASGRWTHYQANRLTLPYLRAFTVGDERVRHPPKSASDHTAWDGIILPVEHPFWRTYWPPLGFRCRCAIVQMTRSQLARYRGGITSDAELDERIARLGPPVFLAPSAPIGAQLAEMVKASNEKADRMPDRPSVDPEEMRGRASDVFDEVLRARSMDDLSHRLDRMFPRAA